MDSGVANFPPGAIPDRREVLPFQPETEAHSGRDREGRQLRNIIRDKLVIFYKMVL